MKTSTATLKAIHFQDGIYALHEHSKVFDYDEIVEGAKDKLMIAINEWKNLIKSRVIWHSEVPGVKLYGGRVRILAPVSYTNSHYLHGIEVDGIPVVKLTKNLEVSDQIGDELVLSYLNSIATNGVECFIAHYKNAVLEIRQEIEKALEREKSFFLANTDEKAMKDYASRLKRVLDGFKVIIGIWFLLQVHLPSGIENEKIIAASDKIVQLFA